MEVTAPASHSLLLEDAGRRARGRQRFYVVCQLCGWLFFLGLHVAIFIVMDRGTNPYLTQLRILNASLIAIMVLAGLLTTHYTRPLFDRWGWKNLGWRALIPRIFGMTLIQATLLVGAVFAYPFFVLQYPWPAKDSMWLSIALTWVNAMILFGVWYCVYFFYHLFERFNRSELERAQLAASAKEAELRSLKSQVNPHFIFNSLNSLRALIDEDPARARQSVTQLANLLRYSLQSGQLETVPFEDELRVVNDYLALEQVRHEERLRVRLDVAPDTLQLPIPPMLLQTLVENAVKYGISTQREGGEIAIVARQEGSALRLQVINPGSLPDASRRAKASASTGMGLKNASDRLRLLFGERATLNLRSATPDSVVAEAVRPLRIA
jgi:hypothetical protein